jgi:putative peptidoglycan binding protein
VSIWEEAAHPRGQAGSAQGGEFVAASGSGSKPPAKSRKAMLKSGGSGRKAGRGPLGYNGKTGTGYGHKGGDPRVRDLQTALNRLGLTDSKGRKLAVDGQFGPLTTQAVKDAQRRLGVKPDGRVTPALLRQLATAKSITAGKPKATRHPLVRGRRPLKTSAAKPAAKKQPPPRRLPLSVQRAIARIPADQRK